MTNAYRCDSSHNVGMDAHQLPRAAGCAADAPTGPVPTVGWTRPEKPARIETIIVPVGDQAWQAQRVMSLALRRSAEHLTVGAGICSVVAVRPIAGGVGIDLLVPTDARRIDEVGAGDVSGQQLFDQLSVERLRLLLTPIVESLCLLHDAGLAHGGITMSAVHRRSDGRGVLVGFDPQARPDDDVADMAALILDHLSPGSIDGQAAALLTRAVDADPHRAPTMAELAQLLSRLGRGVVTVPSRRVDSPPARRRLAGAPEAQVAEPIIDRAVAPEVTDPITRLRRNVARRTGHRGEHRARRARAMPWPMVSAMAGSSVATWLIASVVM